MLRAARERARALRTTTTPRQAASASETTPEIAATFSATVRSCSEMYISHDAPDHAQDHRQQGRRDEDAHLHDERRPAQCPQQKHRGAADGER